jgi:hypothetical protein
VEYPTERIWGTAYVCWTDQTWTTWTVNLDLKIGLGDVAIEGAIVDAATKGIPRNMAYVAVGVYSWGRGNR